MELVKALWDLVSTPLITAYIALSMGGALLVRWVKRIR